MPVKKATEAPATDVAVDIDDILNTAPTQEAPKETELERVKRENAELAEALAEQKALLDSLKQLKAEETKKADVEASAGASGPEDGTILLHFVQDGFTISGAVYYRGQELEFDVPSLAYEQQKDRNGDSWLDFVDDPAEQIKRYGKHYFSRGAWPYRKWGDDSHATDEATRQDIKKASEKEKARSRKAPTIVGR